MICVAFRLQWPRALARSLPTVERLSTFKLLIGGGPSADSATFVQRYDYRICRTARAYNIPAEGGRKNGEVRLAIQCEVWIPECAHKVREQQKKWEELKLQQQKKQEELEASARAAISELQNMVSTAEASAEGAHYTAAPFAGDHEMEVLEVLKLCKKVERTGKSAMAACQACVDTLGSKKASIEEAENIRVETSAAISALQPRIQAATRLVTDALNRAKENRDRIAKRIATAKRTEKKTALFSKYDQSTVPGSLRKRTMPPQRLPRGILPDGIDVPEGTDIMQFCRDLAESGAEFAEQFDRSHPKFHNGNPTAVPLGGARIPDSLAASMAQAESKNWRDMPDAPLSLEDDYGPEHKMLMDAHKTLNECKKAIAVVNKPVEVAMRLRCQYRDAEGDDKVAYESRLKGAENDRDGALDAATVTILGMSSDVISDRCRQCVEDVVAKGKFEFVDKETYGEYIQVLKRANQEIFMDQKRLLQRIKDVKKAFKEQSNARAEIQEEPGNAQDADGRWNRAEISAYAKGEFNFDLPAENLDRIMRQICGQSEEGLAIESMQLVKVAVGIAREEEKSKAKRELRLERERKEREEREQKEAEIRARHAAHSSACQALMAELQELEPTIASAESMSEAMVEEANAGKIREAQEAKQRLQVIETAVQATHSAIAAVQVKAQELSTKVSEDAEMVEHMAPELAALAAKTESQDLALRKALASAGQARQLALHRAFALYEGLRMEVAAKLRVCIETQGGKPDDLYDAVKSAGGGAVTKSAIKAYLEANQSVLEEAHLETMFPTPSEPKGQKEAEGGQEESQQPEISKEDFMHVIRIFYKVVKEIVLSDNLLIEQSEQLRRMDVGEVMEVFQGPMLDPSVGVYRIHGKALRDGITGWVTVAGNQGITFLMPGGNLFKVIRPSRFTDFPEDLEGEHGVRQLMEGEILEVLAWQRVKEGTPAAVTRLKAKLQGANATGWVSMSDSGIPNLEVL
ncbi:unnamed protein product [Symbiodinium necroappetens]|uniref:Uncharacterized protein n=1 Tax=Symbiodinium necroappetens TaxID=1628268 RepID=A0A813BLZ6_9DINO|nr:unnamed protein product [Symbiodinium necroappetens]